MFQGITLVSVPVLSPSWQLLLILTAAGHSHDLDVEALEALSRAMQSAATRLSESARLLRLGWLCGFALGVSVSISARNQSMAYSQAVAHKASTDPSTDFDAIIIGAGVSGLYQLYRLRELGLTVRVC
jgi:hypothetical protein